MLLLSTILSLKAVVSASLPEIPSQVIFDSINSSSNDASTLLSGDCWSNYGQFANVNGKTFVMACGKSSDGAGREIDTIKASTFSDCVQACADDPDCRSIDHSENDQRCRLSDNINPPYADDLSLTTSNAYLQDIAKPDCPGGNGTYRWVGSRPYKLACGFQPPNSHLDKIFQVRTDSLAECVNACGAEPECQSVYRGQSDKICVLLATLGIPGKSDSSYDYAFFSDPERAECPNENGRLRIQNTRPFQLACGSRYETGNTVAVVDAISAGDCVKSCGKNPACNAATFEKATSKCKLLDAIGAPDKADSAFDSIFSSDGPNQDCPSPDADRSRVISNNRRFVLGCGKQTWSGPTLKTQKTNSLSECINLCGKEPSCYSVDRRRSDGNCLLKSNTSPPAYANSAWDTAFALETPACPLEDDEARIVNGEFFRLGCQKRVYSLNPNILKTLKTSSSAACVDTCGNTPGCLSADWNRTSTNCYIQKEPGPAKSNNTDVDSAWLMPRPNCPSSDGFIRVFHGQAYKLSCGKQAAGNRTPVKAASIGECVDMCAVRPGCKSADYGRSNGYCWFLDSAAPPRYTDPMVDNAYLVGTTGTYSLQSQSSHEV